MYSIETTQENVDHILLVGTSEGGGQPAIHVKQRYAGTTHHISSCFFLFKNPAQVKELIDVLQQYSEG